MRKTHRTFQMFFMIVCNKFTYVCKLMTLKHFPIECEDILPSSRLVKYPKLMTTHSFLPQILFK